jgi:hypothetical protein
VEYKESSACPFKAVLAGSSPVHATKFMHIQLIDIGRGKVTRVVEYYSDVALLMEVKKHLASRDVAIAWHDETMEGTVYAGFRPVGRVKKINLEEEIEQADRNQPREV